ncbi:NUDIX hydrolase [Streptomyces aidingensis]|uniref:ADP-ribose pyrophosphatase YjhB, NUDIX family n=1 Tax=Streptomyces aidingensis TaxID=910347 RepID=A0A1I1HJU4_9ACTN|nr:NUDIX hydrolase [Streptomyces aidingensis]SFC21360.1 ADP-ribose pyrophosphatase YjhB, NUDIX family [Streptomyces aidingensis]
MRWQVHGERQIYSNPWMNVWLADVEQPDGHRYEHHVIRLRDLAVAALLDEHRERVLMLWRHRFVTDTWAWELPMGLIENGETPQQAAARELEEETGWRAGRLTPLVYAQPAAGILSSDHHVFLGHDPRHIGEPTELNEASRIEWIPLRDLPAMIDRRQIVSSATLTGLLRLLISPPAPR